MNLRQIASFGAALVVAVSGLAQSATLSADKPSTNVGAEVTLTASATFATVPGAVGWAVKLPDGWSYVATSGTAAPQITPQVGDTGTLEWAYTDTPPSGASFSFRVKVAGGGGAVRIVAKVLVRIDGKVETIETIPLTINIAS